MRRSSRLLTPVLAVGVLVAVALWVPSAATYHLPGDNEGYSPVQPIAYSHKVHAGDLQIACSYCHWAADRSRHAGIPAASVCMNCHRAVTASVRDVEAETERAAREKRQPQPVVSPEIRKIYDHLGLGDDREREPGRTTSPIAWSRIYSLPEFVYFDHRAHVGAGVRCQHCHGPVETMDRVKQVGSLGMGWCVDCHRRATEHGIDGRAVNASIDCSTCHR